MRGKRPVADAITDKHTGDLWVFGYGSLMWRPGFDYLEKCHARLYGYHRAFCVYSHVHRGTPEKPGLVFGLDHGGSCRGIAYRVCHSRRDDVVTYLREREQVTMIYREETCSLRLLEGPARRVDALCYLVDRSHHQYAGKVDFATQVNMIAEGHGQSGKNPEYLHNTVQHMHEIGIDDAGLLRLWQAVSTQLAETA